ncbi:MAG TPA: MFS transporter [Magnetospirillaceae bacterium]|jgi:MFS family permease
MPSQSDNAGQASKSRPGRSETVRAVVAATIGNGIEWFDFISFGYFTPFIAKTFFPTQDPTLGLILTWATYGLGIIVRPVAGAILGIYGDRIGRRKILSGIIMTMALGILIIAVTPGYATIGIAAPILILAARILQGISATGEYSSGVAFLVEYAPPGRKYLFGSFQFVSQSLAIVLSTFAAFVVTTMLAGTSLADWGWRIPFLLGVLVGPIGFYIRRRVAESPEFTALHERTVVQQVPFGQFVRENKQAIVTAVALTVPGTLAVYLWFLYCPSYAIRELHLNPGMVNLVTGLCSVGLIGLCPLAGYLSDRVGPWRWFLPGLIALGVTAWPLFTYLVASPDIGRYLVLMIVAMLMTCLVQGPLPQLIASLFPTRVRSSGLGLSINLSVALFGGLAPLIITALIKDTGDKLMPAYYIVVATTISLLLLIAVNFGKAAHAAVRREESV